MMGRSRCDQRETPSSIERSRHEPKTSDPTSAFRPRPHATARVASSSVDRDWMDYIVARVDNGRRWRNPLRRLERSRFAGRVVELRHSRGYQAVRNRSPSTARSSRTLVLARRSRSPRATASRQYGSSTEPIAVERSLCEAPLSVDSARTDGSPEDNGHADTISLLR